MSKKQLSELIPQKEAQPKANPKQWKTLNVPPEIRKAVRIYAAEKNMNIGDAAAELLTFALDHLNK